MQFNMQHLQMRARIASSMLSSHHLELIIFPTEQCNFRCTYCYEDFSIGKMNQETVASIKRLLDRRISGLKSLKLSWFGGEPLSARDVVYDLGAYAHELCLRDQVEYTASMTTNGYHLSNNIAQKLVDIGVTDFQVSLDGSRDQHNLTRRRINGSGSFDKIWDNLVSIRRSALQCRILLRLHVTPDNIDSLFELVERIKQTFGGDQRFSIFFKAIANLGGPNSGAIAALRGDQKSSIVQSLIDSVGQQMTVVSAKATDVTYVCYAAHANSYVIRANGTIGKCTVALSSSANSIGRLLPDGSMSLDHDKLQLWLRGIRSFDKSVLQCPLNGIHK